MGKGSDEETRNGSVLPKDLFELERKLKRDLAAQDTVQLLFDLATANPKLAKHLIQSEKGALDYRDQNGLIRLIAALQPSGDPLVSLMHANEVSGVTLSAMNGNAHISLQSSGQNRFSLSADVDGSSTMHFRNNRDEVRIHISAKSDSSAVSLTNEKGEGLVFTNGQEGPMIELKGPKGRTMLGFYDQGDPMLRFLSKEGDVFDVEWKYVGNINDRVTP